MKIKRFEELEVWQAARQLAREVYELTEQQRLGKDWSLKDQMRRAAISIMANIAEGFERESNKDFRLFLNYSSASAAELKSHLYLALDVNYVSEEQFRELTERLDSVAKQIKGFRKYLQNAQHSS